MNLTKRLLDLMLKLKCLKKRQMQPMKKSLLLKRKGVEDIQAKIDALKSNKGEDVASKQIEDKIRQVSNEIILQRKGN